jgi:hypothetical protein
MNVETTEGYLLPGNSDEIQVDFNSEDLELGEYYATIKVNSNDEENPQVIIPVTLQVVEAIVNTEDLNNQLNLNLYPNPATDVLFMEYSSSDEFELNIRLINQTGAILRDLQFNTERYSKINLDVSEISSGVYYLLIKGEHVNMVKKVVIQ